jgi:hypothetical protein
VVARYGYCFPFDIDLTPATHIATHTHFVEKLWVEKGVTYYTSVFEHFNWMGKVFKDQADADIKATTDARNDVADILGHACPNPEFIALNNGLYKRNPRYPGNGTVYEPGLDNEKVWTLLSETWLERFGTPEQKALIARYSHLDGPFHQAWPCVRDYRGFHADAWKTHVTWEEFKNAGHTNT